MKEGDDSNGQNDRTDLGQENQHSSTSRKARPIDLDLIRRSPYRPAASEKCRNRRPYRRPHSITRTLGSETSCTTGGNHRRAVVAGRSAHRSEEQDHAPLSEARHAAIGTQGPEDEVGLYLRRDLSRSWQGCGAGAAILQYRNHDAPSCRDIACRRARCPCRAADGSGGMAYDRQAGRA